jgi:hypothetical protein
MVTCLHRQYIQTNNHSRSTGSSNNNSHQCLPLVPREDKLSAMFPRLLVRDLQSRLGPKLKYPRMFLHNSSNLRPRLRQQRLMLLQNRPQRSSSLSCLLTSEHLICRNLAPRNIRHTSQLQVARFRALRYRVEP